jgi:hypothetical protein
VLFEIILQSQLSQAKHAFWGSCKVDKKKLKRSLFACNHRYSYPILACPVDLLESPNGISHSQQHKPPTQDKAKELQVKLQKYGKQKNWGMKIGSPDRKSETYKINLVKVLKKHIILSRNCPKETKT